MREINRRVLPCRCHSLHWSGDELVDWVGGGMRISLSGDIRSSFIAYSYHFDQALISPDQKYIAIYERLGTKGLLLNQDGKIIREIDRSFYHANDYEYPLSFVALPDGRTGIAHCPDSYDRLVIEEVETGAILTSRESDSVDFFHSRLVASANSRYLLNAGWVWQPIDMLYVYDLERVYAQPEILDKSDERFQNLLRSGVEINNAAFLGNDALIFTTNDAYYDPDEEFDEDEKALLGPLEIAVYDLTTERLRSHASLQEPAGLLMPVGEDLVVGFYEHPKLIDLKTGKVLVRWPDIESGKQDSCIMRVLPPPIAIDAKNRRFAVATKDAVTVIELG